MTRKFEEELEKLIQKIVRIEIDSRIDIESLKAEYKIDKTTEEKKLQRVRNELTRKGYLLEIQVYKKLKERNWISELNANYWDVETDSTIRPWEELHKDNLSYDLKKDTNTIDIVASKHANLESRGSFTEVSTKLVIECKHSDRQNWAFFLESGFDLIENYDKDRTGPVGLWGSISYLDSLIIEQSYSGVDAVKHLPGCDVRNDAREQLIVIGNLNWASHHSPRTLKTAAVSGITLFGPDNLYEATMQVLNASIHQKAFREIFMFSERASRHTLFEFWRVYPVIIFDGPLWAYEIESDELVIKPLDWVTLYAKRKDSEYAIDIVSINSIDEYLDIIGEEVENMKKGGIDYWEDAHRKSENRGV